MSSVQNVVPRPAFNVIRFKQAIFISMNTEMANAVASALTACQNDGVSALADSLKRGEGYLPSTTAESVPADQFGLIRLGWQFGLVVGVKYGQRLLGALHAHEDSCPQGEIPPHLYSLATNLSKALQSSQGSITPISDGVADKAPKGYISKAS